MKSADKQHRIIIENLQPIVGCGSFPAKRVVGETVKVTADVYGYGHDEVDARCLWRKQRSKKWNYVAMQPLGNDRWEAAFTPDAMGKYEFTVQGRIDFFATWQKKIKAKISVESKKAQKYDEDEHVRAVVVKGKKISAVYADLLATLQSTMSPEEKIAELKNFESLYKGGEPDPWSDAKTFEKNLVIDVERTKALFSTWYELFPRSAASIPHQHGTFKDVQQLLPRIKEMGFDVLYLPPIHPIGKTNRKGKNNSVQSEPGDPGSPWAIGANSGGHKSIHSQLGTLDDFKDLIYAAKEQQLEIAMDIAYQCSPDHPYIKEHPEWFKWQPDGTIQYAENPPKKYEDIVPINFETHDWMNLWMELKSVIEYWIQQGVRIFRIDNPHTKPFDFWQWLIREVRNDHPDVIFLSEAFTRMRVMERLAKIGFTQSYTYFTWRTTKDELAGYIKELTQTSLREYFRPNFWPNTPDIFTPQFYEGREAVFISRVVLAATLSSNYGIYGPVYELGLHKNYPGKEELIDSEKYEIKYWDWGRQTKTREIITKINLIRKENPALQSPWHILVAETDNPMIFAYVKTDQDGNNPMLIVVNLDDRYVQSGFVKMPLQKLKITSNSPYTVHDLLTDESYTWNGERNYVELHPEKIPAHVFRLEDLKTVDNSEHLTKHVSENGNERKNKNSIH